LRGVLELLKGVNNGWNSLNNGRNLES